MSPGGGQNGRSEYGWNDTMARYWQGYPGAEGGFLGVGNTQFWNADKNKDWNITAEDFEKYDPKKRVTDLDPYQDKAIEGFYDMAYRPESLPDVWAGRQQNTDTAQGKYLGMNPYASARNTYEGMDNPYFKKNLQASMQDVTDAYERGTAADTRADMALGGLLGSSAHTNVVKNNQENLSRTLSRMGNEAYAQQYDRSGNMEEARLGRAAGAYEGERGRMLQGAQGGLQGQGLSTDLYRNLAEAGGMRRGVDQQRADFDYGQWQDANRYGMTMADWMGNYLSRAQGGIGGSVNMYGGGGSPLGQALGTAMMGYGMFRS